MKIQLLEAWTVLISNLRCMSFHAAWDAPTNSKASEQSRAWHRPCPWNLRHWRWWYRFSNSLVETWDATGGLLTEKKPIAPQKGCLSQRFWALKIRFLVSIVAAFSKSNVAIWIWVIPTTSGASQMPFDPPVPRDWTNRITCKGWLFLPGPAWAPNFLNESLKWWFVLVCQEDRSPSILKLASWREYGKQHAPNFNHYPSGLLHDPLGAGSGGRTALFFLLLRDQPDQLVTNMPCSQFSQKVLRKVTPQTCFLLKSLYNSCVIAIDCNEVA